MVETKTPDDLDRLLARVEEFKRSVPYTYRGEFESDACEAIPALVARVRDLEGQNLNLQQQHIGCHAERDELEVRVREAEADLAESDREDDARQRFDSAIREGTNAMMKEALGTVMYARLWGVELERLGHACDVLRADLATERARREEAEAKLAIMEIEEDALIPFVTRVVREADQAFERVGGSSRHWVRDCFLPILARYGGYVLHRKDRDETRVWYEESHVTSIKEELAAERATTARLREALKSCEGHVHVCHAGDGDFRDCVKVLKEIQ